jgi:outer membrane protein assembly factor BamB
MFGTLSIVAVLNLLWMLPLGFAGDWPQWRGPHRDGTVAVQSAPASWPERLKPGWKITVGEGHSSPILAGAKIFVFTRQQGNEVVTSVNPDHGKVIWQKSYAAAYNMNPAASGHGSGPKSTPVFASGKLYTLGISGILICWDAATGEVRWRKDFSKQFRETSPLFGAAMSPIADAGLLIAHVGGQDDGALTAFDADSGELRWRWAGDGPGYASPVIADLDGTRQIITQTQTHIVGVSESTGELLWELPFTTQYMQNIVTPLIAGDLLIFSGIEMGITAVRPVKKDGKWFTETVWQNKDLSMYMSSPVLDGELLFGFSHRKKGQFFCLNARTGATQWTGDPRQGENAAVLIASGNLILLKDDAELIFAHAGGKSFDVVRRYTVADSPTWAHPLIMPDGVVIKDATTLAFWSVK